MEQQKTHFKKLQNPDYIGAYTIMDGTEGKELTVTVNSVTRDQITGADGKKEECTVCYLQGQKPMILNSTNQKIMAKLFGSPYIEDWVGKSMTLYVARIKAFGDTVDALRVRPTPPVIVLPELNPSHPKWGDALKGMQGGSTTLAAIMKFFTVSPENQAILTATTPAQ